MTDATLTSPWSTLPSVPIRAVDQASRLRAIAGGAVAAAAPPAPERHCPVVAISSGKGGVGKTTIAVNLAVAIARRGLRVMLLDADLGLANADLLCGVTPTIRLDAALAAAGGPRDLGALAVDAPGGFRLIPGAVGLAQQSSLTLTQREALIRGLMGLTSECDLLLVDTGAGIGDVVTSFAAAADLSLIVITPEPTSMADGYALLKCLQLRTAERRPRGMAILVNQAATRAEAESAYTRMAATCGKFLMCTPGLVGICERDEAVPAAVRARIPAIIASPKSRFSKDLHDAAGCLIGLVCPSKVPEASTPKTVGFWRALLGK